MNKTMPAACGSPGGISVERAFCVIMHVPAWFQRSDFLDWRQGMAPGQWEAPASWVPHERDAEHGDVFLVFDRRLIDEDPDVAPPEPHLWDGSDLNGLPDDIYVFIGAELAKRRLKYGLLWLKPD